MNTNEATEKLTELRIKTMELERRAGIGQFDLDDWIYIIQQYHEFGFISNACNMERRFQTLIELHKIQFQNSTNLIEMEHSLFAFNLKI